MKYEFGPKSKLIGYIIGFAAGVYALLYSPLISHVKDWGGLILSLIWYILIGTATIANAWGMLHQSEAMHKSNQKEKGS